MPADVPIPAVYMRGGTSKGLFLHASDLPPARRERDELILRLMGSPDPLQIDGMGGTYSSTSKVVVVERGPGDAVTYWFGQVGIDTASVDWSGNCGNLTTAVGPFAIDEGLVPVVDGSTRVRLINGNTGVEIHADVQVDDGRARVAGDCRVAGVPGTGAPVVTRYLDPAGGVLGSLLPFHGEVIPLDTPEGTLDVSLVDAAHPNLFVRLADLELAGDSRTIAEMNTDQALRDRVESIRAAATVRLGRARDATDAARSAPAVPRITLVGPGDADADVRIVAFSMGAAHRGLPMTGALCLAAAASLDDTLVTRAAGGTRTTLRIGHALGVTEAVAERGGPDAPVRSLGVVRTARRLMDGRVHPRPDL